MNAKIEHKNIEKILVVGSGWTAEITTPYDAVYLDEKFLRVAKDNATTFYNLDHVISFQIIWKKTVNKTANQ